MGNAAAPRERRPRRVRLIVAGLAALCVVTMALVPAPRGHEWLPAAAGSGVQTHADARLAVAASQLAGRSTGVWCWSPRDWKRRSAALARRFPTLGVLGPWRAYTTVEPVPVVHFSPGICATLLALADRPAAARRTMAPEALAWAVAALAHESMHASGILDEAYAECYGMQNIRRAAMLLGRKAPEGQFLAELYFKQWYRRDEPPYSSRECRNGGRLDLRPGRARWP